MSARQELPVTPEQAVRKEGAHAASHTTGGAAAPGASAPTAGLPPGSDVPSWRLITTLAVAGALAGLLIVTVFRWAQPQILEYRAQVMASAIQEVLGAPARTRTLYVRDGALVAEPPAGVDTVTAEKVFAGYDAAGNLTGYAILGAKAGFQDVIQLIFGYDPATRRVLGMKVLESKETPGLGDKIFKDLEFVAEFAGVLAPIRGVKEGAGEGAPNEVDMITGATISSRAVIDIINGRVQALEPVLGGGTGPRDSAAASTATANSASTSTPTGTTTHAPAGAT